MTIFVDQMTNHGEKGYWCHMWSGDLDDEELINFAVQIGLKPEWLHVSNSMILKRDFPHFDLVVTKRRLAIQNGAQEKSLYDWLKEKMNGSNSDHQREA
jgi:hypothetical protein